MANNPYSAPSISGYNTNPPPDGGEQTAANEITWAKHKDKLADPIKTYVADTNTQVTSAFGKTINTDADENNALAGSLAFTANEKTISSGAFTATRSHHTVDTESDAASDDLDTIATSNVSDGAILVITPADDARTIVVKHESGGAGQIHTGDAADYTMDDDEAVHHPPAKGGGLVRGCQKSEPPTVTAGLVPITRNTGSAVAYL